MAYPTSAPTSAPQTDPYYCICADENYEPPTGQTIPGTVEAEEFLNGGQYVGYYNIDEGEGPQEGKYALRISDVAVMCTDANDHNYTCINPDEADAYDLESIAVGYLEPGEWLRYMVDVSAAGYYKVSYSISRELAEDTTLYLLLGEFEILSSSLCSDYDNLKVGEYSGYFPGYGEGYSYASYYDKEADEAFYLDSGSQYIIVCLNNRSMNINSFTLEVADAPVSITNGGLSTSVIIVIGCVVSAFAVGLFALLLLYKLHKMKKSYVTRDVIIRSRNITNETAENYSANGEYDPWGIGDTEGNTFSKAMVEISRTKTVEEDSSPTVLSTNQLQNEFSSQAVSHLPYVQQACKVLNEIAGVFLGTQNINDNCEQILRWANSMKGILDALHQYSTSHPEINLDVNMDNMNECLRLLDELLYHTQSHKKSNTLLQYALSQNTQKIIDDVSMQLGRAIEKIPLDVSITCLRINLRVDEHVSLIMGAMNGMKIDMTAFGAALKAMEKRKTPKDSSDEDEPRNMNKSVDDGYGPLWDNSMYANVEETLKQLELPPTSLKILQKMPIGVGGFAKVYKVEYKGIIRAAKVVNLVGLSTRQLQKIYLKFAKELYTLTLLSSPRIVSICGSITSLSEFTIVLEYMEKGSLRKVLNEITDWRLLNARERHQILLDICEGMAFLHKNRMYHRDLKSDNVLITDDFRAKLTDFGLSKTATTVSSFSRNTQAGGHGGGTLAWMPPEAFDSRENRVRGASSKHDVYSYGIVIFEVLAGLSGPNHSTPWRGYTHPEVIVAVLNEERPKLPTNWDIPSNVYCAKAHASMMRRCLGKDPHFRPGFTEMMSHLEDL